VCPWHGSFICVTWHIPMGWLRLIGSLKIQVSFAEYSLFYRAGLQKRPIILRSLLIVATPYTWDMTHSYVWHASFICVTWLIHMCDLTDSYVWHDSFMRVTWLIHMCDTTHSYVWHASWRIPIRETRLIHMCDMPHDVFLYVRHDSFVCVRSWRRAYGVAPISRLLKIIGLFCRI